MISTKEAKEIIMSNIEGWGQESVDISHSVGRILREDIVADRDFPPFDRVTMDGIAIRLSDFESGILDFEITDMQTAGEKAKSLDKEGAAIEIMTGAILSKGANANVRYEDLDIYEKDGKKMAKVKIQNIGLWQNVHLKGKDRQKGGLLIKSGRKISSADVAALATVGKSKVMVSKLPKIAVISTGDELVEVDQTPESHQIRMSNSISIEAKLNELGIDNSRYHFLDDYETLLAKVEQIVNKYDVVILSGGVSKGKADYIPQVLADLNVKKLFHRVAQRPGKPFWFGKAPEDKCVFALPGNPISTFMCFNVYFLPWLNTSLKLKIKPLPKAVLSTDYTFKPELTYYLQVEVDNSNGQLVAKPNTGGGSGDLSNLLESDAFLELPAYKSEFETGEIFYLYSFRTF